MGEKIGRIIGRIIAFFINAWFVLLLWNSVIVPLLEVNGLKYWGAAGLLYLFRTLTRQTFIVQND